MSIITQTQFENRQRFADFEMYLQFDPDLLDTNAGVWVVASNDIYQLPCNGVSVRSIDGLQYCSEFFKQFPIAFIAIADPAVSAQIEAAFSRWISTPTFRPREGAFGDHPDISSIIDDEGTAAVDGLLRGMTSLPVAGLIPLNEAKRPEDVETVLTGISKLDRAMGGFTPGEVTVITGRRGDGKSTFINQIILEAVEQGRKCCLYSGELTPWRVRQWLTQQAAGSGYLKQRTDPRSGLEYTIVDSWAEALIVGWLADKLVLTNNATAQTVDGIIELWEAAAARGYTVFCFDNIMSAVSGSDVFQAQSELLGKLVRFAHKYKAVVLVVAHPRKTAAGSDEKPITSASEVGGSGDIANKADNVICVCRLGEADQQKYGCNVILNVLKNRAYGYTGMLKLQYDAAARRFACPGDEPRVYSWVPKQQTIVVEVDGSEEDVPF